MKQKIKLPKIPSKLLRIAVEDMKATLKAGININMDSWGNGTREDLKLRPETCSVCMAGAVMLQRGVSVRIDPDDFEHDGDNSEQYGFLDELRCGNLRNAMDHLEIEVPSKMKSLFRTWTDDIPDWLEFELTTPENFFVQCMDLADTFESIGL